jgi:hypothetical protein
MASQPNSSPRLQSGPLSWTAPGAQGNRGSLASLDMREIVGRVSTNIDRTYKPGYGGM